MVPFFFIMTYITATASQTELSAINRMLASVGVAPVTSIETESINRADGSTETVQTNPDVAIAVNTLTEVSREVQSEGWVFNKEYNVKVTPNNNNELVISELETTLGNIIIQIDLNPDVIANKNRNSIVKNGKLYDKTKQSYEWTDTTVYVDVMYEYNWIDLPVSVQDYIVAKAAALYSQRVVGDANQYQILQQKADECRIYALNYDCEQGDYTFFGHPAGQNYYNSYQPFHTLQR
jgi:hypothetical protein